MCSAWKTDGLILHYLRKNEIKFLERCEAAGYPVSSHCFDVKVNLKKINKGCLTIKTRHNRNRGFLQVDGQHKHFTKTSDMDAHVFGKKEVLLELGKTTFIVSTAGIPTIYEAKSVKHSRSKYVVFEKYRPSEFSGVSPASLSEEDKKPRVFAGSSHIHFLTLDLAVKYVIKTHIAEKIKRWTVMKNDWVEFKRNLP